MKSSLNNLFQRGALRAVALKSTPEMASRLSPPELLAYSAVALVLVAVLLAGGFWVSKKGAEAFQLYVATKASTAGAMNKLSVSLMPLTKPDYEALKSRVPEKVLSVANDQGLTLSVKEIADYPLLDEARNAVMAASRARFTVVETCAMSCTGAAAATTLRGEQVSDF